MISNLAERTATFIKTIDPEQTASVEVMKYGIIVLFNGISVIVLSLAGGMIGGKLYETMMTLAIFAIFRFVSGGYHFTSAWMCVPLSTAFMIIVPYIHVSYHWMIALTVCSFILTLRYAPGFIEGYTRIPVKMYPLLKVCSVAIVLSNFFFLSPIMSIVLFAQSILLIQVRR